MDPSIASSVLDPLAMFVGAVERERPARVSIFRPSSVFDLTVQHYGLEDEGDVVLAVGADALSCTVRGTIEGIPCEWNSATMVTAEAYGTWSMNGFRAFHTFVSLSVNDEELHVLSRRPGAPPFHPGSYDPLIGVWPPAATGEFVIPVVPELSRMAGELIAPSPDWCTQPQVTCAGESFDGRFPLENELSADGDEYESSWRYWLGLAAQAAREADELAERVIEQGLGNDMRAEAAMARLEELCGGSVDLDGIVEPEGGDARGGPCPCGEGYVCRVGECIRDPIAVLEARATASTPDPGAARLYECLGADTVHEFVALGTSALCLWRHEDNHADVCPNVEMSAVHNVSCPIVVADPNATDCEGLGITLPAGYEWFFVNERLGYYESREPGAGQQLRPPPCAALRQIRRPDAELTWESATALFSGFFDPVQMSRLARRVGFEARIHDYSGLTLDGRPWRLSTGDPFRGPSETGLLCDPMSDAEFCTHDGYYGESPFACRLAASPMGAADCGDADLRAMFNDRLLRAVLVARTLNNQPLDGVHVPMMAAAAQPWVTPLVQRLSPHSGALISWARAELPSDLRTSASDGSVVDFCHTGSDLPRLWRYYGDAYRVTGYTFGPGAQSGTCGSGSFPRWLLVDAGHISRSTGADVPAYAFWAGMGVTPVGVGATGEVTGGRATLPSAPPLFQVLLGTPPLRAEPSRVVRPGGASLTSMIPLPNGFAIGAMLDSVELLCEAAQEASGGGAGCDLEDVPDTVVSARDLSAVTRYIECAANSLQERAESTVFARVPARAVDALRRQSSVGAFPATGGVYSQNVTQLRQGLVELASVPPLLANEVRGMANDLDRFRTRAERIENERDIAELNMWSNLANQVAQCLTSALQGDWSNPATYGIVGVACGNAAIQTVIAREVHRIQGENADLDGSLALQELRGSFYSRIATLSQLTSRMQVLLEQVDTSLAGIDNTRRQARSALSQALYLDSDPADVHARVNRATRNRYNLTRVRYERAHQDAVRMAFMAKRAVEQRLGMPLAMMRDDMALVEAPARWEARVCELSGVDYARLRDETDLDVQAFADEFIGDYVRRLERVVQSYQIDHPFQDGRDTAVVSLRDDVQNIRGWCEHPTNNLLYEAGQLDIPTNAETGEPVWTAQACDTGEPNCVAAVRLVETDGSHDLVPFILSSPELEDLTAHRVYFGNPDGSTCSGSTCGMTANTTLGQDVSLPPGRYRISWYGAFAEAMSSLDPADVIDVVDSGSTSLVSGAPQSTTDGCGTGWTRYWRIFDLDTSDVVRVRIVPDGFGSQAVDLAGLMLEDVSRRVVSSPSGPYDPAAHPPGIFENTRSTLTRWQRTCEDTRGDEFRSRAWRRNCVRLCAEGFGRGCERSAATSYCYWETSFTINQRDIEHARTFRGAGFARGNYNYRIDSIALNVVGTGVRDCAAAGLPSTCYSGGFVPYTLEHLGPYTVRNVLGNDYDAPLFTARIEQARALGAERHITNPVSSADRTLLDPYTRYELRGRPINGTYLLRIWDEPGIDFQRVEDVQVVLGYRYWTRSR
ncbi:MAG: hypothetical protein KF729_15225 [Sandaracinaceae bacterium]|nr:hypothetical protein [Sandaracinaceae bacterium]